MALFGHIWIQSLILPSPLDALSLSVWLSAPNKLSIRPVFFDAHHSRSLPTAALPVLTIVSVLTCGEATQRTNCPQMACRNGRLVSTDCSTALISSCAELQEQRHKHRQDEWILVWGDGDLTVMSLPVWSKPTYLSVSLLLLRLQ